MTTPSTLTPPTRVPISAAAAVVTMARSLLLPEPKLPEPKLFRGDLMSGIADLLVIRPRPRCEPSNQRAASPGRSQSGSTACLDDPAVPPRRIQPLLRRHSASRLSGPAPAKAR